MSVLEVAAIVIITFAFGLCVGIRLGKAGCYSRPLVVIDIETLRQLHLDEAERDGACLDWPIGQPDGERVTGVEGASFD